jgi:hypothetical protein
MCLSHRPVNERMPSISLQMNKKDAFSRYMPYMDVGCTGLPQYNHTLDLGFSSRLSNVERQG